MKLLYRAGCAHKIAFGALVATVSFDSFFEDTIVVHFGGETESIDAYTFAEALIGFANTAYAVSSTIDPGQEIEILIEATGAGSWPSQAMRVEAAALLFVRFPPTGLGASGTSGTS